MKAHQMRTSSSLSLLQQESTTVTCLMTETQRQTEEWINFIVEEGKSSGSSLVVRTWCFRCCGPGSVPAWGTES